MKNFFILFISILLVSCTGATTIPEATSTPTESLPTPFIVQMTPTAQPVVDLGAKPDEIAGVKVAFWYALSGKQASLLEQEIAKFNLVNPQGIQIVPTRFNTIFELRTALTVNQEEFPSLLLDQLSDLPAGIIEPLDWLPYMQMADIGMDGGNFIETKNEWNSIPFTRSARFLLYNASFAQELGFRNQPKTLKEFEEQICSANQLWKSDDELTNDNFGGYLLIGDSNWQEPISWMINSPDPQNFEFSNGKKALLELEGFRDKGCIWYTNEVDMLENLEVRKTILTSVDIQSLAEVRSAISALSIQDRIDLIPYPGEVGTILYGFDLIIPKSEAKTQMGAYLFARWLLEDERQVTWTKELGLLPVTHTAAESLVSDPGISSDMAVSLSALESAISITSFPDLNSTRFLMGDGFYEWITRYPFTKIGDVFEEIDANSKPD